MCVENSWLIYKVNFKRTKHTFATIKNLTKLMSKLKFLVAKIWKNNYFSRYI